ncbi:arrestin domain-containing protein 1-like isoform X2 [Acanthaster planci]|uniref:Arrestin domain-containing protein 1-like isoform X2 n=1 Tax=Acanthaster planci TaxID=133434 RepID=A0A8B7ZPE5_ACAPL|nr:arrestin domain-containing protein 1-like isoform X2 [Acanthaster planci]
MDQQRRENLIQRKKIWVWIKFKGVAKTEWTNTSYNSTSGATETKYHVQREDYLKKTVVLFGTGKFDRDIDNLSIPPGTNNYPFELPVPDDPLQPKSFQGIYGYIRYTAKATLSVRRMHINTETKTVRPFSMMGPAVDLSIIPGIQNSVKTKVTQYGCCGCGTMVERVITIGVPRRGYFSNDAIYVIGQIDNRDGEEEIYFDTTLVQRISFSCGRHTRTKEYNLSRASKSVSCPRGWVTDFTVGPLHTLISPPSGLPGCDLIDVEYYVKCIGCKFTKAIPVIIGTMPVRGEAPVLTAESSVPADVIALRPASVPAPITQDSNYSSEESETGECDRLLKSSPQDYDLDGAPPGRHIIR